MTVDKQGLEAHKQDIAVGMRVEKFTGEARWHGVVVSEYQTTRGMRRFVVDVEPQGFQMIAVPSQLRPALAASPSPSMEMEVVAWTSTAMLEEMRDPQTVCGTIWPTGEHVSVALVTLSQAQSALAALSAQVIRLTEDNEALRKDLAAQIAGHQETARQSTDNLVKANAASARIKEAEDRAAKNWRDFRDLRLEIIGHGPMCRDCADFDGRCQGNGQPCDPDEAAKEKLAAWKAAEARIKVLEEALEKAASDLDEAAVEVQSWGAYASEYFQDKHDLEGSADAVAKAAAAARSALKDNAL